MIVSVGVASSVTVVVVVTGTGMAPLVDLTFLVTFLDPDDELEELEEEDDEEEEESEGLGEGALRLTPATVAA